MATNIPPHNLAEVVDGIHALIDQPELEIAKLIKYIKGPTSYRRIIFVMKELKRHFRPDAGA